MSDFKQLSRSVKGLTVLVTGAASGMGRATARVFAAEGANVAVTDYDEQGAQAVTKEIAASNGSAKAWKLDVADGGEIKRVVGDVAAHFGGLDIVVNNAGISVRVAIDDDVYEDAWARGIAVMLTAHPRIIRAALPHLRKSNSPRIVNIASTEALGATALHSPYSAAKGGVASFTRSLAVDQPLAVRGRNAMTVAIRQLHKHFVGEVSGLDLRTPLTKGEAHEVEAAMDKYAVLVFHDQDITDDQQMAFALNFGQREDARGG